jgi:hypothetical protein
LKEEAGRRWLSSCAQRYIKAVPGGGGKTHTRLLGWAKGSGHWLACLRFAQYASDTARDARHRDALLLRNNPSIALRGCFSPVNVNPYTSTYEYLHPAAID